MKTVASKLNKARELKKEFKLEETVQVLRECLEIDPHCVIASAQAGFCLLILGKPEQAEELLSLAFEDSQQNDFPVAAYLSAALTANGKEEQAKKIRNMCKDKNPEFSPEEIYMVTAEMMEEKNKHTEALRLLDVLSSEYKDSPFFQIPVNHYRLIRVLANADVMDVAEPLADALSDSTEQSWEGLAARAAVSMAKKDYENAYSLTVRALQRGGSSNPMLAAQQHWLALNK